jgi:CubicO group peptidase (beta-lactamase class C family)
VKRAALCLLSALLLASCAGAPPRPANLPRGDLGYVERYLDWYVPKQMRRHDVPGVSIALVSDQRVLWMKGFGYADAGRELPVTPATVFQVGSISKLFTAAAVMREVERERLDLDAPIQSYLPEFSIQSRWGEPPRPTLRELLSHHAGLPTYYLKGFFSPEPLAQHLRALRDEHLAYPPRTIFNYSNLGPNLAGAALERLSGASYADYMRDALLDPLRMRRSSFALDERVRARLARGYVKGSASDPVTLRDVPAGGLYSNVEDLARFMRMMLAGGEIDGERILRRETAAAMLTPQFAGTPFDFDQRFGLGWMLSGIPIHGAGPVAWHNGGTKTFLSQMILLPEKRLGVVVLANADRAGTMVYETAEEVLKLALETREGIIQPPPPPRAPEVAVAPEVLDRYAGDYSLNGTLAGLERRGNRLRLQVLGHTLELVPVGERNFRAEYRLLGLVAVPIPFPPIEFREIEGRTVMLMRDRGIAMTAERIPPHAVPPAWARRTGAYRLVNPDKEYLVNVEHVRLSIEEGKMLMNVRLAGLEDRDVKVVLMPLGDDRAYTFGIGRNVGDVSVIEPCQGKECLRYLGYLFEPEAAPSAAFASAAP